MSRVYIVLLNWNNWPDTLECLESLLSLDYPDYRIIVCDNGSTDNSLVCLREWALGNFDILPADPRLKISLRKKSRPIHFVEYERSLAELGGNQEIDSPLVVIRNQANLGFAGGNNVGLRYVLARGDADYAWILNNDTVVDSKALGALVSCLTSQPTAGICGSSVLSYWNPQRVDALGGAYYCRWFGIAWHLGRWREFPKKIDSVRILRRMNYVVGSSMFVAESLLREVGLMEESYFLYFEELDWTLRSKGLFNLAYAPESIVYHKVGGTIGTSSHPARKSMESDFYTLRNRLKFSRRHYPYSLPTVYLGLLVELIVRLVLGRWRRALMIARLMSNPHCSIDECLA